MALITTVATTPLTKLLYPLWYQQKVEKYRRGEIDWEGNPTRSEDSSQRQSIDKLNETQVRRLLVYLRLDSLPSLFTFISLLGGADASIDDAIVVGKEDPSQEPQPQTAPVLRRHLQVHGIRIIELTERTSSVMKVSEVDELARRDPVVNTFRTFSQLNDVAVSGQVAVVPAASFPETLATEASETSSDFVLIPWGDKVADDQSTVVTATSSVDRFNDRTHLDFVYATLEKAVCNIGVFIDNGFGGAASALSRGGDRPLISRTISVMSIHSARNAAVLPVANKSHRVFFPFFGGADDRVALRFVLQLAKNKNITATIAHVTSNGSEATAEVSRPEQAHGGYYAEDPTQAAIKNKEAALEDEPSAQDLGLLATLQSSLPADLANRVTFVDIATRGKNSNVLDNVVERASKVVGQAPKNAGDIIVVGRRHSRLGDSTRSAGESSSSGYDLSKTVGVAGAHVINANPKASVLVVQAAFLRDVKA